LTDSETHHEQFPSCAARNSSWSRFVIRSVFLTTSSCVGRTSLSPCDVALSALDSAAGDSTASVGVTSVLLVCGTLIQHISHDHCSMYVLHFTHH